MDKGNQQLGDQYTSTKNFKAEMKRQNKHKTDVPFLNHNAKTKHPINQPF